MTIHIWWDKNKNIGHLIIDNRTVSGRDSKKTNIAYIYKGWEVVENHNQPHPNYSSVVIRGGERETIRKF